MNVLKVQFYRIFAVSILFLSIAFTASAQTADEQNIDKPEFVALAKLVRHNGGSKVYISEYKVIKDFSGALADTVMVAYYFRHDSYVAPLDTVLLTLNEHGSGAPNYYICPDYNAEKGIVPAQIHYIDFKYWENCEKAESPCKPLRLLRDKSKHSYLFMPCGGTNTTIHILHERAISPLILDVNHSDCPPCLYLNGLPTGKYAARMWACNLGGSIEFNIIDL